MQTVITSLTWLAAAVFGGCMLMAFASAVLAMFAGHNRLGVLVSSFRFFDTRRAPPAAIPHIRATSRWALRAVFAAMVLIPLAAVSAGLERRAAPPEASGPPPP